MSDPFFFFFPFFSSDCRKAPSRERKDSSAAQVFRYPWMPLPVSEGAFGLSGVVAPTRRNTRRVAKDGFFGWRTGEAEAELLPEVGVSSSPSLGFFFPSDRADGG